MFVNMTSSHVLVEERIFRRQASNFPKGPHILWSSPPSPNETFLDQTCHI